MDSTGETVGPVPPSTRSRPSLHRNKDFDERRTEDGGSLGPRPSATSVLELPPSSRRGPRTSLTVNRDSFVETAENAVPTEVFNVVGSVVVSRRHVDLPTRGWTKSERRDCDHYGLLDPGRALYRRRDVRVQDPVVSAKGLNPRPSPRRPGPGPEETRDSTTTDTGRLGSQGPFVDPPSHRDPSSVPSVLSPVGSAKVQGGHRGTEIF